MFDSIKIQFYCFSMKYQWWSQTFGQLELESEINLVSSNFRLGGIER